MKKRLIIMLAAVVFFLGAIAFVKVKQIQTAIAQGSSWQPPPEAVTTIVAGEDRWPVTIGSIGTVVAVHGVTLSADLPGKVEKISFESGRPVHEGDVLVVLDTSQETAQLSAAEAQRDLSKLNFQRMTDLRQKGVSSQADFDRSSAELKQNEAAVGEIQATIERKTIRAPFSGILGIRQVNLGQYVRAGDPIVPLQSMDPIYVNFSVPQQQVGVLKVGDEVEISLDGVQEDGNPASGGDVSLVQKGRITAINSIIDPETRNVQVQATLENPENRLRPGMFVKARVILGPGQPEVVLPASAVNYAPYGTSIFIVEDMKGPKGQPYKGVRQEFVKLGPSLGDQVAVLQGLKAGEEVVTSGVFKLHNGSAVQVNNSTQPTNNPAPRPEDS